MAGEEDVEIGDDDASEKNWRFDLENEVVELVGEGIKREEKRERFGKEGGDDDGGHKSLSDAKNAGDAAARGFEEK